MAEKKDHVIVRDGSAGLGGPRPAPPAKPAKPLAEADSGSALFGSGYSDPSTVGHFDVARKAFETQHGTPSPRERGERGEDVGGTHTEPGDKLESGVPSPID